jgi:SAM-dependent methyltransferase
VFAESLGYPLELLDSLPPVAVEAFAGVSNVAIFADIPPGSRVLDLGCGAGLDALVAAQRSGCMGKVIGIDFSDSMLDRALRRRDVESLRRGFRYDQLKFFGKLFVESCHRISPAHSNRLGTDPTESR